MTPVRVAPSKGLLEISVRPGVAGPAIVKELTVVGAGGLVAGPFSVDFSDYEDGPVPENETGLRDAFLDDTNEDEMGIRDGKLAVVDFRGPDQSFTDGGGRRGYLWRNTVTLTDNVTGPVEVPLSGEAGNVGGSPTLHISPNGVEFIGIACWFVPSPFNWTELGCIGKLQEEFAYLDLHPGTTMPVEGDDIFLRSVDGMVALEVNGETICGPCEIPAELLGSPLHGVQMDVAADADEAVGMVEGLTIGEDSTPLGTRSAPLTPAIGSPVETASSTTLNVPYPSGISAGHSLYCIIATKNGGTISASGWTDVPSSFGIAAGLSIRVIRKTAVGSEAGTLTVTKSTAGIMAGVMVRVTGDQAATAMVGQGNTSASTSVPAPAIALYGPRRTALWLAAANVDTNITSPAGWFPLSTGLAANQDLRLHVAVVVMDDHADFPDPPIFNAYAATHYPSQVGTAATSTTSCAGMLILHPAKGT